MRIKAKLIVKNYEIEERRKLLGYTQEIFADVLNMPTSRLQKIENLSIIPTEEEAKLISLELNADTDLLFPSGYKKIVDVFENKRESVKEFSPSLIDNESVLAIEHLDAELTVKKAIKDAKLSPKEYKIISLRNGLSGGNFHTLEQVAKKLDVTPERIRQVEAKATEKMRCVLRVIPS